MYTIIETAMFRRYAEQIWQDDERESFITWLAADPLVGDVIPGTGGVRKVRWWRQGSGKRGGVRVIYYNTLDDGQVWLLIVYSKSKFDNLPASLLRQLREELDHG
ncbi:transcriptional regulator [Halomonas sp. C05BenzN]|uniref:transcriptional regulator n=1 Tax=Halomonas sp. C05BenzN TaxID=3411041 RepID=UPI003B94EBDA